MKDLEKNKEYTVLIDGYSSEAMGVCHIDSRAVFVPRLLKGEQARISIVKVGSSVSYARPISLLTPSPERRQPQCPYFGSCGGCDTCHMSYDEELRFKLDKVNFALCRIGGQTVLAHEIIGSGQISRYRNKGIFSVGECGAQPAFGFYRERSHALVPVDDCLLQSELSCRAAAAVVEFMRIHSIPAYSEQSGKGLVRHVFCRQSVSGKDAVVCIVSSGGFGALTQPLSEHIRAICPELSGIVLNVNKTRGNTVLAGDFYTLWGSDSIRDTLCGLEFEIAPRAFFQINPPQAERLYRRALEYACEGEQDLALDLYCGAGTISLCLAGAFKSVIGAEIVPEAIENARQNAGRNGIKNAEFICADAGLAAQELLQRGLKPDVILVDPPRKGMSEDAVAAAAGMKPERIVYVSCDPATLARDIKRFNERGYLLQKATAVDMFPRTSHVETVILLSQRKPDDVIEIDFDLDELDITSAESKATYQEIKNYVLKEYGLKVSSLYISQIKRKCGIDVGEHYNFSQKENQRVPQCPQEKEDAIRAALEHFAMI